MRRISLSEAIRKLSREVYRKHKAMERKLRRSFDSPESKLYWEFASCISEIEGLAFDYEVQTNTRIARLENELSDLKKRFKLSSENSHRPPSAERFKKIKNSREKTGRGPGGQKGHKGHHRELESDPDSVERKEPAKCRNCGRGLKEVPAHDVNRRQEIDLKKGKMFVTEYQAVVKICPDCGDVNQVFPSGAPKAKVVFGNEAKMVAIYLMVQQLLPVERTQEILRDLFQLSVSQGTLCNFLKFGAGKLKNWRQEVQAELINASVGHFDETGIRCEKRNDWIHVASTSQLTLLTHSQKRGKDGADEAGILPYFKGMAVHDAFKSYFMYNQCDHSLCNAHLLRELKYLHEEEGQSWAKVLAALLQESIHKAKTGQLRSLSSRLKVQRKFKRIIRDGFILNGYENDWRRREPDGFKFIWDKGKRFKVPTYCKRGHTKPMQVLNRLRDYQKEFLRFVFSPGVPPTNNQAERDFRMAKVKEKISGCFRSKKFIDYFLTIKSFFSTLKKQKLEILLSLRQQLALA